MKIGVVGCGHMGSVVARVLSEGQNPLCVCDHSSKKTEALIYECGCEEKTAQEILEICDVIVLGMKPQGLPEFLVANRKILQTRNNSGEEFLIVSMAAGTTCQTIQDAISFSAPVMRIMPNTPFAIGQGAVPYCVKDVEQGSLTEKMVNEVVGLFSAKAMVPGIDEANMDAVVALSGSGPAFVYRFISAMASGGEALGLSSDVAQKLAIQTVLGSAALAKASDKTPEALADEVCSPGGTTIEGVKVLDGSNFSDNVLLTLRASFNRSVELSQS